MKKAMCIYHKGCSDGFGAAWAVRHALGESEVEYFGGVHSKTPPDVAGRDVIMVDFSYKKDVILEMSKTARSILILDHHKTAEEDLKFEPTIEGSDCCQIKVVFDMERSGAVIAWEYYHPNKEIPQLLLHIQDRDLWKFALNGTRTIMAAIFSYPQNFEMWDGLMKTPLEDLKQEGAAINRHHMKCVDDIISTYEDSTVICGYKVPVVNAPFMYSSDVAGMLAIGHPFAAVYALTKTKMIFSLRSAKDGIDVSKIAKLFGGGGHKNAAGFSVDFNTDVAIPDLTKG